MPVSWLQCHSMMVVVWVNLVSTRIVWVGCCPPASFGRAWCPPELMCAFTSGLDTVHLKPTARLPLPPNTHPPSCRNPSSPKHISPLDAPPPSAALGLLQSQHISCTSLAHCELKPRHDALVFVIIATIATLLFCRLHLRMWCLRAWTWGMS